MLKTDSIEFLRYKQGIYEKLVASNLKELQQIDAEMIRRAREGDYKPTKRIITKQEVNRRKLNVYNPCPCGSGTKLKFCCYAK